jgi:hypothetical protein
MGPPGHLAIGFMAKPTAPKVPLWALLLATELLDFLTFGFEVLGIEDFGTSQVDFNRGIQILSPASVPWSHGLFMSVVWSVLVTGIAYLIFKEQRPAAVLGLVVFSHWVLDFIVHLPDLPLLFEGSPKVGLGLWGSGHGLIISGILEIGLLAAGIVIYVIYRRKEIQNRAVA